MAAYAALVSLMHTIHQIQNHPRPPVSLDRQQVQSLTQNVTFLQEFLENYTHLSSTEEGEELERRIADAARAAEDAIDSYVVDQFQGGWINFIKFHRPLQKVDKDMDLIRREVMEIRERMTVRQQLPRNSTTSSSIGRNTIMVGFDSLLLEILDKLTGGPRDLQTISVIGMGGSGKTTLVRHVYVHPLIVHHFDIRVWVTISREHNTQQIFSEVLSQVKPHWMGSSQTNVFDIGGKLYKYLFGRKYLIIMDDMWSIDAWNNIKILFSHSDMGSRIVVTTRLSDLARQLPNSSLHEMKFLDEMTSWELFSNIVFPGKVYPSPLDFTGSSVGTSKVEFPMFPKDEEDYPDAPKRIEDYPHVVEIGKRIVRRCRGLPLSIVVIGGLLAKSNYTSESWEHIEENLNSSVSLENDEQCLKILLMSYEELPVHLKPCFLYMGVFKEGCAIRISKIVKLWVAEGFLKPISGRNLEDVARKYLRDLVDRNLILVHTKFITSKPTDIKCVNVHDLLRDMCLRLAQKERFYSVIKEHMHSASIPQDIRRFILSRARDAYPMPHTLSLTEPLPLLVRELLRIFGVRVVLRKPLTRSLICNSGGVLPSLDLKLLRIFEAYGEVLFSDSGEDLPSLDISLTLFKAFLEALFSTHKNMFPLITLRHISVPRLPLVFQIPSSWNLLRSLQTLIVYGGDECFDAPPEIWNMLQLRHVQVQSSIYLPNPPVSNAQEGLILGNLQTLLRVRDFSCSEEVAMRIPNVKKLAVEYAEGLERSSLGLDLHFDRLNSLKSFEFTCMGSSHKAIATAGVLERLTFPHSLEKLSLNISSVMHWDDILEKIGSLPLLHKLILRNGSFRRRMWETVDGQFSHLKVLKMYYCDDLELWVSDSSHFPRLEHLHLSGLILNEIPQGFGEIPTLKFMELNACSESTVISAKRIQEEQVELYGSEEEAFRVEVILSSDQDHPSLKSLASPMFHVFG